MVGFVEFFKLGNNGYYYVWCYGKVDFDGFVSWW